MERIGSALALLVVIVSFGMACGGGEVAPPIPGETIVFVGRKIGSPPQLYLLNADGTGFRQLTDGESANWWPTWSPDGTRIAYLSWAEPEAPETETPTAEPGTSTPSPPTLTPEDLARRRLVVKDLASGEETVVADSLPVQTLANDHSWSPDGTKIVYMAVTDPSKTPVRAEIHVIDLRSGDDIQLADGRYGFLPAWSPDGTKIAFGGWVSELEGSEEQESDVFIVDSDGSNVRRLVSRPGADIGPVWSPDSTRIVWWGYRPDDPATILFMADVDSGEMTELGEGAYPAWSPDGRRIALVKEQEDEPGVFSLRSNLDILVQDVESGERTNLTTGRFRETWLTWSPDGTRIAFVSTQDNPNGEVYVMDTDGSNARRLTENDLEEVMLAWSPGRALAQ